MPSKTAIKAAGTLTKCGETAWASGDRKFSVLNWITPGDGVVYRAYYGFGHVDDTTRPVYEARTLNEIRECLRMHAEGSGK